jgi:hypothetical protein
MSNLALVETKRITVQIHISDGDLCSGQYLEKSLGFVSAVLANFTVGGTG